MKKIEKVKKPTFKCATPDCSFTTAAESPGGLVKALARHRKKQPAHRKLTRAGRTDR